MISALTLRRLAIAAWLVMLAVVCLKVVLWPGVHTVVPVYALAADNWLAGKPLYHSSDAWFRYSPLVAVLFVPFRLMPGPLPEIFWRLFGAAIFIAGIRAAVRSVFPRRLSGGEVSVLFLLLLPLSLLNFSNGQANTAVAGALLLATAAFAERRLNAAAAFIALAFAFKLYPVTLGLLFLLIEPRRFAWRLAAAIGAVLAIPFLFQYPAYVSGEYAGWLHSLQTDGLRADLPMDVAYRDLRLVVRACGFRMDSGSYLAAEIAVGAGIATVCVAGLCGKWPRKKLLVVLLALALCWMTLLGPATESATYLLLAPALAWAAIESRHWPVPVRASIWLACGVALLEKLLGAFPAGVRALSYQFALDPASTLLFFIALLAAAFTPVMDEEAAEMT